MKYSFEVENIKCGGCANTVRKQIVANSGVSNVEIDTNTGNISITADQDLDLEKLQKKLASIGYPVAGTGTGFQKARSYVSCMLGRMGEGGDET